MEGLIFFDYESFSWNDFGDNMLYDFLSQTPFK